MKFLLSHLSFCECITLGGLRPLTPPVLGHMPVKKHYKTTVFLFSSHKKIYYVQNWPIPAEIGHWGYRVPRKSFTLDKDVLSSIKSFVDIFDHFRYIVMK
jgi:hypothetical protein